MSSVSTCEPWNCRPQCKIYSDGGKVAQRTKDVGLLWWVGFLPKEAVALLMDLSTGRVLDVCFQGGTTFSINQNRLDWYQVDIDRSTRTHRESSMSLPKEKKSLEPHMLPGSSTEGLICSPIKTEQRFEKPWHARVPGKQHIMLPNRYSSTYREGENVPESWMEMATSVTARLPTHLIFLAPSCLNSLPISLQSSRESMRQPIIFPPFKHTYHHTTHNGEGTQSKPYQEEQPGTLQESVWSC